MELPDAFRRQHMRECHLRACEASAGNRDRTYQVGVLERRIQKAVTDAIINGLAHAVVQVCTGSELPCDSTLVIADVMKGVPDGYTFSLVPSPFTRYVQGDGSKLEMGIGLKVDWE
jgi:hypothetical protein